MGSGVKQIVPLWNQQTNSKHREVEYALLTYKCIYSKCFRIWYLQMRLDCQEIPEDPEEKYHFIHTLNFVEGMSVNDER